MSVVRNATGSGNGSGGAGVITPSGRKTPPSDEVALTSPPPTDGVPQVTLTPPAEGDQLKVRNYAFENVLVQHDKVLVHGCGWAKAKATHHLFSRTQDRNSGGATVKGPKRVNLQRKSRGPSLTRRKCTRMGLFGVGAHPCS